MFNYRRVTWTERLEGTAKKVGKELYPDGVVRLFGVKEVYYNVDGKPSSYSEANMYSNWDNLDELAKTNEMVQEAFEKPVLDIDSMDRTLPIQSGERFFKEYLPV